MTNDHGNDNINAYVLEDLETVINVRKQDKVEKNKLFILKEKNKELILEIHFTRKTEA